MKHVPPTSFLCERGREWISLRLDDELSELAQKMLDSHLARCADCRAFEEQVAAIAIQLRAAPLEELERPVEIVGRRFRVPARMWSLGAAAASIAAAAVGVVGFIPGSPTSPLLSGGGAFLTFQEPADGRVVPALPLLGEPPAGRSPAPATRRGGLRSR